MAIYDGAGKLIRANPAFRRLLGLDTRPDLMEVPSAERGACLSVCDVWGRPLPYEQWPLTRVLHGEELSGASAVETQITSLDGRVRILRTTGTPYLDEQQKVIGAVCTTCDVTERTTRARRLDALFDAGSDRLRQVLDALPVGVQIADGSGAFVIANRAAVEILGIDVVGRLVPTGRLEAFERYGSRKDDGTPCPSELLPLSRALFKGEEVRGEHYVVRNARDGRDVPLFVHAAPLRGEDGSTVGAVVVFEDSTALLEQGRMREDFLASAAHDLKSPLASIRGLAQLAQRRLTPMGDPRAAAITELLDRIDGAVGEMAGLINELLDLSRLHAGVNLDLDRRSTEIIELIRRIVWRVQLNAILPIHVETAVSELWVSVDKDRIERVFANLLGNALNYGRAGQPVTVHISREHAGAGSFAVIAVSDRGLGIPAADLPRIFDRFYRGANVVSRIQGTGIGLATVRQIVEQHAGTVSVESEESVGSTFTVRLPLHGP